MCIRDRLYIVISHVLWFFGIHGTNTLEAVSRKLFESEIVINQDLLAQGLLPTHIFSKTFLDTFVFIGGCGLSLIHIWESICFSARFPFWESISRMMTCAPIAAKHLAVSKPIPPPAPVIKLSDSVILFRTC